MAAARRRPPQIVPSRPRVERRRGIGADSYTDAPRPRGKLAFWIQVKEGANAADAHPGRRRVGGGVGGAVAQSAGGPGAGGRSRRGDLAGGVAVPGLPAFDPPRPFNACYPTTADGGVLCAAPADVVGRSRSSRLTASTRPSAGRPLLGGHSSASSVVIDVSAMQAVSIDGDLATVGLKARLGAVYDPLSRRPHYLGGSCPAVEIAGLTLGGGVGILGPATGDLGPPGGGGGSPRRRPVVVCDEDHESDCSGRCGGRGRGTWRGHPLRVPHGPGPDVTNVHLSWPFSDAAAVIGGWQAWAPFGPRPGGRRA